MTLQPVARRTGRDPHDELAGLKVAVAAGQGLGRALDDACDHQGDGGAAEAR